MSRGNLNPHEPDEEREAEPETFELGDAIRLREKFLRSKDYSAIGPRVLMKVGWPNLFYVERLGVDPKEGPAVSLSACCCNLIHRGDFRCRYHPAYLFEKINLEKIKPEVMGEDRPSRKGDRTASVVTPFGEAASYEYFEDEKDPGLILKLFGQKIRLNGDFAKRLFDLAKERGIV